MMLNEKYIDPFTDFGFKKLFGSEPNADLLIDFLNGLLRGKKEIRQITYLKNEQLGKTHDHRKAIFDLYCESEEGEKFIIELQRIKQKFFKDRSLYYATFPIQEQAPRGDGWKYALKEVYTIGIMDFIFDDSHPGQFLHEVKLLETHTREVFSDKLTFLYLEMPKFIKREAELESHFEKWLFLLQNLSKLKGVPHTLQEQIFKKVFLIAEISKLSEEDMKTYEASLKEKRDWYSAMETLREEGMEKGIEKGVVRGVEQAKLEIARKMKQEKMSIDLISRLTGLSPGAIEKI